MNGYPPGVTGAEYAIAGPDYEADTDETCPECGEAVSELGYGGERWLVCIGCDWTTDLDSRTYEDERDDALLARWENEREEGRA